jgi:hypothetical protein
MLQMLLEETEKCSLIGELQIVILYFPLAASSDSREHRKECDEMLAVHAL